MNALDQAWGVLKESPFVNMSNEALANRLIETPPQDPEHRELMEEAGQRMRDGTGQGTADMLAQLERVMNEIRVMADEAPAVVAPPDFVAEKEIDFPPNFDREKLASADAFTSAWDVVKTEWKLFPKKNEKSHEIGGERPVGYSMVPLDNLEATTSYVNLPFIPQYRKISGWQEEQDIADNVLAVTSHEDTHRAMAQIGEFYDNPAKDEYAPHITEAIMRTRDKGQFTMPVTQLARLLMRLHPQVKRRSYE